MFQSLKHKLKLTTIAADFNSGESQFLRQLSTETSSSPVKYSSSQYINNQKLYKRLSAVGGTGEKIRKVLHSIKRNGGNFTKSDLIDCLKAFRKYGRYHHCREILEWMDKGKTKFSASEYALRLSILSKVKGIDEVEKYFDSIPPYAKNHYVYGALLSCYCAEKMTDKALALFKTMDELNYTSNCLAFNNMMSLYMKVGNPEKVFRLVEEMKEKNIPLTNHTYYTWIQCCRCPVDLERLERVKQDAEENDSVKDDWQIYSNLAGVYIEAGEYEKANTALNKVAELLDDPKKGDRDGFHYLISMYSRLGNIEAINQSWDKLKSRFKFNNTSYLVMLRALSKLDDIERLKKCLHEWESGRKIYDDKLPTVVISAYLRHDMLEEAEHLLKDVKDKGDKMIKIAHINFLNYFLEKRKFDSALRHLDAAMEVNWKPVVEKLDPFFEHYKEQKDVDSAEELCKKLEKVQLLDSRAYSWLLQTYADAGKTALDMRERMKESGVDISTEHEALLQKIY
ncbi:unnamed protein product [Amaranthus hypochondriacus]